MTEEVHAGAVVIPPEQRTLHILRDLGDATATERPVSFCGLVVAMHREEGDSWREGNIYFPLNQFTTPDFRGARTCTVCAQRLIAELKRPSPP